MFWSEDGLTCHELNGVCGLCPLHKTLGIGRDRDKTDLKRCWQYDHNQRLLERGVKPRLNEDRNINHTIREKPLAQTRDEREQLRERIVCLLKEQPGCSNMQLTTLLTKERFLGQSWKGEAVSSALSLLVKHQRLKSKRQGNTYYYYVKRDAQ